MKGTGSLKEATWEQHKKAEEQPFVGMMLGGMLDPESYAIYLYNQIQQYDALETVAYEEGLLEDLPDVRRVPGMKKDFEELWESGAPPLLNVTKELIACLLYTSQSPRD